LIALEDNSTVAILASMSTYTFQLFSMPIDAYGMIRTLPM